jgi:small-conductance mechanosensitive channel
VVDIGLRTTRIRTRDNRMVIVPNSLKGRPGCALSEE